MNLFLKTTNHCFCKLKLLHSLIIFDIVIESRGLFTSARPTRILAAARAATILFGASGSAATILFGASGSAATIRERRLIESGV